MALLWMDGFDAYGADGVAVDALLAASGYTLVGTSGQAASPAAACSANTRDGVGFSLNTNSWHNGYSGGIMRSFPLNTGIVVGFAVFITASEFTSICQFGYNNLLGSLFDNCRLFYNLEGGITATDGSHIDGTNPPTTDTPPWGAGNLLAASPANVLFPGVWQYIEVYYSPTGTLQVKVDGAMVINITGAVSTMGVPQSINYVSFLNEAPNAYVLIDDFYICDLTGSTFNNFLGDVVVHAIFPISDATPNQWTQFGGSSGHFTCVDDNPAPDDDTSYLSSDTSGQQELFNIATFPSDVIDVLAVSVNIRARKDTAGYAFYNANLLSASVDGVTGPIPTNMAYSCSQSVYELAPGGGAWTTVAAQAAQIGFNIP